MSSSSTSPDVFLSFRGDLRKKFMPYLTTKLDQEEFSYFYDDEPQHAGKRIQEKIDHAIDHARAALIVLSKNYADSKWCLYELDKILARKGRDNNFEVIPVFYGVCPADVKNLTGRFGQAFERLRNSMKDDQQKFIWKTALENVKNFSGLESEKFGEEPDLLDRIVQSLFEKITPSRSLNIVESAVGADRMVEDLRNLLKIGQKNVRVIGISGAEGIGKTMVAKALCKDTLGKFERFIILDKVGEANEKNLRKLRKKLFQNLTRIKGQLPQDNSHGFIERIKNKLGDKKILLVLDGVTKEEQLKELGVEDRTKFCLESRILITTRDRKLLEDLKVDDEYIVEGLNRDEAFRLFCLHAFKGEEEPKEGYELLSRYLAHYVGGHPSALQGWGSFLQKQKGHWQEISDRLFKEPKLIASGRLLKKPERTQSTRPCFKKFFQEYPCSVVGTREGDRRTGTWKDEAHKGARKIGGSVDSEGIKFIEVQYGKNSRSLKPVILGTEGGETSTLPIKLNYPGEYLIYMSGHTKKVLGHTIIQSLTFHTNKGKRISIGTDEEGRKFSFPYTGHKIVGFYWSSYGSHLESIEAIYKRIAHTPIDCSGEVFGPFGGAGEISWDPNDINGISVRYANFINSVTFKVEDGTSSKPQTNYGGNGDENTFKIKLKNAEYIIAFSGYFKNAFDGRILISSLTFRTNKRILGPIGSEGGKHFSSPSKAVRVIRFFRGGEDYLETIGACVELFPNKLHPFKSVGLFGSSKGSNWSDWNGHSDGKGHTNVKRILVKIEPGDGKFIRSITFWYEKNGRSYPSERHGGANGKDVDPIEIDGQDEYLTSMSGYYMDDGITSLMFGTNKGTLKLIGRKEGIHFSFPATGGKIVGFYGTSDENLKGIGAYFEPNLHPCQIESIGPFGGSSGETWEYRNIEGVREIKVKHQVNIHYIMYVYKDGSDPSYLVGKDGRAEQDNSRITEVTLDYPREYLTSISGYAQDGAIKSLTFYSNKKRYGPCGKKDGKYFWYPSNGSRITGFYGTRDPENRTLKSIGVYVEPIPRMYPFKTVKPLGGSGETPWDDGVHTDVRGFRISFDKAIKAIGIAYDNNGSFVSGPEHGHGYNHKGSFELGLKPGYRYRENYAEVILDYPEVRLDLIWVWVDKDRKPDQIQDLEIVTADEGPTYGPFVPTTRSEEKKWTRLRIPSEEDAGRRIVGFFGRKGEHLNAIGARLEPC